MATNPSPLARARLSAGRTQAEVAAHLGVTQAAVSRWEGGSDPTLEQLVGLLIFIACPEWGALLAAQVEWTRAQPKKED